MQRFCSTINNASEASVKKKSGPRHRHPGRDRGTVGNGPESGVQSCTHCVPARRPTPTPPLSTARRQGAETCADLSCSAFLCVLRCGRLLWVFRVVCGVCVLGGKRWVKTGSRYLNCAAGNTPPTRTAVPRGTSRRQWNSSMFRSTDSLE